MTSTRTSSGVLRTTIKNGRLQIALLGALAITIIVSMSLSSHSALASTAHTQVLTGSTVTIGVASRAIDAINAERKTDQLILYTRVGTQATAPTNIYGAEVVVIDGKVTRINDRLVTGGAATAIPAGAVVLSGHGISRNWLIHNAKIGSLVVLPAATSPVTAPLPTVSDSGSGTGVTIGSQSRVVNGVNIARGANQLVLYTRTGSQTSTPTNIYGAEVVVTNGRVAAVNDRLVTRKGTTPIPVGSSVLSGHDQARQWLIDNAQVGVAVILPSTGNPASPLLPPTTPAPPVTAPPATAPPATAPPITNPSTSAGLPENVSAMWWNIWQGPTLSQLPAGVVATNNLYIAAIAQSARAGTGNLRWEPTIQSPAAAKANIAAMKAKGNLVLLGIGGSSDGGITVTNSTTISQFVDSVASLVNAYGFQGIDIDLEPSGSAWNQTSIVTAVSQLKAKYGSTFIVGLTVGLYEEHTAKWLALAKALGNSYDYWAPMLYDFPEAHDGRLTAVALDKVRVAVQGGVPANKQILGFMCNAYYNTSPVKVAVDAYNAVRAEFPTIRGAFIWESSIEAANNYSWSLTLGKQVRQGN